MSPLMHSLQLSHQKQYLLVQERINSLALPVCNKDLWHFKVLEKRKFWTKHCGTLLIAAGGQLSVQGEAECICHTNLKH